MIGRVGYGGYEGEGGGYGTRIFILYLYYNILYFNSEE
jgi:hypothetical protein